MEKILSERAHLMCPHMQFGIAAEIPDIFELGKFENVLKQLNQAHPFLHSLIEYDSKSNDYYYCEKEVSQIRVRVSTESFDEAFPEALWNDHSHLSSENWIVLQDGLLQVFVYPQKSSFTVLFAAHHLLCDGKGLLDLMQEFADCYVDGTVPIFAEEHLIKGQNDLPEKSGLPWFSRFLIKNLNSKWKKEGRIVSYDDYQKFEEEFLKSDTVDYSLETIEGDDFTRLRENCKSIGVTVNDWLMAEMAHNTGAKKIIIAFDIRPKLAVYTQGSLGNYASATGVVFKKHTGGINALAREAHERVKRIISDPASLMQVLSCYLFMEPGLIDVTAISTLGPFECSSGKFVGNNMFGYGSRNGHSITNLGRIESKNIVHAMFIPPPPRQFAKPLEY